MKDFLYIKRGKRFTARQIRRGAHRRRVGRRWDDVGRLQLDFLVARGLEPGARLLDVGCGALRAGIHFVQYLEPGHYYGVDINRSLLRAGYEFELTKELRAKLPRDHLRRTKRFDCDFGVEFDVVIAQSLFTHLPLNDIRLCLHRVARQTKVGGRFFATFFEGSAGIPLDTVLDAGAKGKGKANKYTERNPFWYWPADLEWAASFSPWRFAYVGDWGHPRAQKMVELTRVP